MNLKTEECTEDRNLAGTPASKSSWPSLLVFALDSHSFEQSISCNFVPDRIIARSRDWATMTKIGIEPVPSGETANFDGFSELQVAILAVYAVTSAMATIGLALRFYTGAFIVRNLGVDACTLHPSFVTALRKWKTGVRRQTIDNDTVICLFVSRGIYMAARGGNDPTLALPWSGTNPKGHDSPPPRIMGSLFGIIHWYD